MRAFPNKQRGFWFLIPLAASAMGASAGAVAALSAVAAVGSYAQATSDQRKSERRMNQALSQKPTVEPLAEMPSPSIPGADSEAVAAAKKRSIAKQRQRQGRLSTILSDDNQGAGLGG